MMLVHGALEHECRCTGEVCVLVIRNVLHVPSMEHNLILLFIMRAGSVEMNDVPNIHYEHLTVDDHSVSFEHSDLRIHL